jgi:hypothetical protein
MTKRDLGKIKLFVALMLYSSYLYGVYSLSISSTIALVIVFIAAVIVGGFLAIVYQFGN